MVYSFLALVLVLSVPAGLPVSPQEDQVVRYIPNPEDYCFTYGGCDPVLRVKPGTIIETWTEDCTVGQIRTINDLPSKMKGPRRSNPQTGPFYIEGAEPGDTVCITIIDLQPARDYGLAVSGPGSGALVGTRYTAMLFDQPPERVWIYPVDRERGTVTFRAREGDHEVEIPIKPFLGCIGVAPARGEVRSSIVPGEFGGNIDTPELVVGTKLYLGVNVPGALLSIGDGHLVQGGGEIAGTAVESALDVRFKVDLIKDRYTSWPLAESETHIMALGSTRPLEDAYRVALKELVLWLERDYGMERFDALQLLAQAGENSISQVVDPNYTVVAKIAKRYLPGREEDR